MTPAPTELDPFSLVYQTVAAKVAAEATVVEAVKAANIVSWFGIVKPLKNSLTGMDTPEFQLVPVDLAPKAAIASNLSEVVLALSFEVLTNEQRLELKFFPVMWAVSCSIVGMRTSNALADLEYRGYKFVRDMEVVTSTLGKADPRAARGASGWSSLLSVEFYLQFPTTLMKEFLSA